MRSVDEVGCSRHVVLVNTKAAWIRQDYCSHERQQELTCDVWALCSNTVPLWAVRLQSCQEAAQGQTTDLSNNLQLNKKKWTRRISLTNLSEESSFFCASTRNIQEGTNCIFIINHLHNSSAVTEWCIHVHQADSFVPPHITALSNAWWAWSERRMILFTGRPACWLHEMHNTNCFLNLATLVRSN